MKHEYEAKFLAVDPAALQARLTTIGAVQAFPRTLLTRRIFEADSFGRGTWIRLRDEGTRSTLTLKQVTDGTRIDGTKEIETEVSDPHATADILRLAGLTEVRYQENYREEWRLGEVAFDFDTWPGLPTFLEIEGPDEPSVRQAAALLDLDYSEARFGSVDVIYKTEADRDILTEPTLLFSDTEKHANTPSEAPRP
ncbi:class IV adenylate cyclase [Streptomyces parvulus]